MVSKRMSELTDEEKRERREYQRKYMAEYYKHNKKRMIEMTSANQKKNKERVNANQRKLRSENREKYREYYKNWNANLRSEKAQENYEKMVAEGKDKRVGPRDAKWHKEYQKGLKKRKKKKSL